MYAVTTTPERSVKVLFPVAIVGELYHELREGVRAAHHVKAVERVSRYIGKQFGIGFIVLRRDCVIFIPLANGYLTKLLPVGGGTL